MKRSVWAAIYVMLAGLFLTSCNIVVTDVGLPDGIDIYDESYLTSYRDDSGRYIICDNYTTQITYAFSYDGGLESWTSYLRGVRSGDITGLETFFPDTRGVYYDSDYVEVTYTIPPYNAPLAVAPQAIIVKPVIEGYTRLYLQINGYIEEYDFLSQSIPVVRC